MQILVLMAVLLGGLFISSNASAHPMICSDRREIVRLLEQAHKERRTATALLATGALVELYVSPGGGWTMLMNLPGGPACLFATGEEWGPAAATETEPEPETEVN